MYLAVNISVFWIVICQCGTLSLQPIFRSDFVDLYRSVCCNSESTDHLRCLRTYRQANLANSTQTQHTEKSDVTLVTYDTESILEYALYSLAINSVYAKLHGYSQFLASQLYGFDFEPRDQRWNKVKILELLVADSIARGEESHLLVWMDSDLIVLDWRLRMQEVAAAHPSADLIVSQDVDPLNGMVNTGCMIVRCTEWSRAFLRQWWDTAPDRVDGMDQHVFDRVYHHHLQQSDCLHCSATTASKATLNSSNSCSTCVTEKIAILPAHALNSQIPASLHQQASHRVLHLAGEAGAVRRHVFAKGYQEVCRALDAAARTAHGEAEPDGTCGGTRVSEECRDAQTGDASTLSQQLVQVKPTAATAEQSTLSVVLALLPPQLGITREYLQGIDYTALLRADLEVVLLDVQGCSGGAHGSAESACDLARVEKLRAQMRDVMQSRDDAVLQQTRSAEDADTSNSSYAALRERYLEGLRWALVAHERVCELPGDTRSGTRVPSRSSPDDGSTVVQSQSRGHVRLECLQGLVDAAFELFVSAPDPATRGAALDSAAPAVSRLTTALAGTASHAPALYYQFKYLDFRADYYEQLGQRELELDFLTQALAAWRRVEEMGHFGAGNKVPDRNKEAAGILARMARVECADGVRLGDTQLTSGAGQHSANENERARERGLGHIQQSLNYTAAAWLESELSAYFAGIAADVDANAMSRKFSVTALSGVAGRVLYLLVEGCYTALLCLRPVSTPAAGSATIDTVDRGSAKVTVSAGGSPGSYLSSADSETGGDETECEKRSHLHSLYVRLVAQICAVLQAREEEACSAVLLGEVAALQRAFGCAPAPVPVPALRPEDSKTGLPREQPQPAQTQTQTQTPGQKVYKRLKKKQRPLQ